ncbi:channel-forming protein ArfA/OmpATb [Mycobacterium sp. C31M]
MPLLIALVGWFGGASDDAEQALPPISSSVTTSGADTVPDANLAPFSLRRKGNDVILSGQLPDPASVAFALDRTRTLLPGTTVLAQLTPIAGVTAADLTGLDGVLEAGEALSDFGFSIEGDTVTLFGTATSEEASIRLEQAVRSAWPDLNVLNDIAVLSANPAAPSALTGECATLQRDVTELLRVPIEFDTGGATVAVGAGPLVAEIAGELNACPQARVQITGASVTGANAVADALISNGVAADRVTAQGGGVAIIEITVS